MTLSAVTPAVPHTLLDGTAVKMRLTESLSSATAKVGQSVPFEVLEEIDVEGVPVIAKGSTALATVTMAQAKRSAGRAGKLDVTVDSVRLVDGEKAALSAVRSEKGGGHSGAMAAGMVVTSIVFFPAAPFLLFVDGKDITIPEGTQVTAFVAGDMKLDMAKFGRGEPAATVGPVGSVAGTNPGAGASVTVEANVANCDIEIDGEFVGSTPSTMTLSAGKHAVVVKKTGYADWTGTMTVASGSVRLSAEMVAR